MSTAEQKAELLAILDQAQKLKLNAILLQVRTMCDALYASPYEPWSEFLTGTMGKAPQPFYDPLAFAIKEAHARGLELHAWFNPYRASHPRGKSPFSANHISKTHPQWVRKYGSYLWLDPGEPDVQDYVLKVVLDVVKRYDIDGVHFDDYFYPYPEKGASGNDLQFPDEATWKKYGQPKGISRDDWRRANVNTLIERAYNSIKAAKPWVRFGVSPFGIWRPGHPPQIKGFDAYAKIYADSRKWFASGWLDYLAPQLYWAIQPKEQSFPALLNWWAAQNTHNRDLFAGLNTYNAGGKWKPEEIVRQIEITR
ncbi:MAG TPA: family 10 glycosylhydrolase, partial [Verrucomicrobiae bacterium]|nr:family 10 glycosylhydrolase [Verrucomicrobiae bacterium]